MLSISLADSMDTIQLIFTSSERRGAEGGTEGGREGGGQGDTTCHYTEQGCESRVCNCLAQGPDPSSRAGAGIETLPFFYPVTKAAKWERLESFSL